MTNPFMWNYTTQYRAGIKEIIFFNCIVSLGSSVQQIPCSYKKRKKGCN